MALMAEEICRKLRPVLGKRIDRLWFAYLLEDYRGKREIEDMLQILYAKTLDRGLTDAEKDSNRYPARPMASMQFGSIFTSLPARRRIPELVRLPGGTPFVATPHALGGLPVASLVELAIAHHTGSTVKLDSRDAFPALHPFRARDKLVID